MEKKVRRRRSRRKKTSKSSEIRKKPQQDKRDVIPYELWFYTKVQGGILSEYQFDEILAFFRDKGLRDRETKDRYEDIFKLY